MVELAEEEEEGKEAVEDGSRHEAVAVEDDCWFVSKLKVVGRVGEGEHVHDVNEHFDFVSGHDVELGGDF